MIYLMSFHSRWLMATRKSFVRLFFVFGHFQPLLFGAPFDFAEQVAPQRVEILHEVRREPAFALERREFVVERRVVGEGKFFRLRFEEKIERIQHRHFRDQIHLDAEIRASVARKRGARRNWTAGPASS